MSEKLSNAHIPRIVAYVLSYLRNRGWHSTALAEGACAYIVWGLSDDNRLIDDDAPFWGASSPWADSLFWRDRLQNNI